MKQTAVDWLVEQIKSDQNQRALSASEWMQVIEQAKMMEKEQIKDAYDDGSYKDFGSYGEQYYNQTYKEDIQ